ncbi:MAG: hypothetical protein KJZ94_08880, partial [Ignavibacteria bacterium]|nr:hypothetical protein [Ignavibacteria bacterium]
INEEYKFPSLGGKYRAALLYKFLSLGGVPEGRGGFHRRETPMNFLEKLLDGVTVEWMASDNTHAALCRRTPTSHTGSGEIAGQARNDATSLTEEA